MLKLYNFNSTKHQYKFIEDISGVKVERIPINDNWDQILNLEILIDSFGFVNIINVVKIFKYKDLKSIVCAIDEILYKEINKTIEDKLIEIDEYIRQND